MELDYRSMSKLIDIRMKQIEDHSRTHEYFNKEYVELMKMRKSVSAMLILERKSWKDYSIFESVGEVTVVPKPEVPTLGAVITDDDGEID